MKTVNEQKRLHARTLFFQTAKTQGEIAAEVGVSDKTLYLWTRDGDWRRLRSASNTMPSMIVENFYAQVQELNEDIRSRPPGKRYPTIHEAEIIRKMMLTIDRSKKKHTQGEYMELMQKFLQWLAPKSNEALQTLTDYADMFLKSQSIAGFHPYDIEYEEEPLRKDTPTALEPSGEAILNAKKYRVVPGGRLGNTLPPLTWGSASPRHPEFTSGTGNNTGGAEQVPRPQQPVEDRHPEFISGPCNNSDEAESSSSSSASVIIGNYEDPSQPFDDQTQNPQNETQKGDRSVIINPSQTGNNDNKPRISAEELLQLLELLKKMDEQNARADRIRNTGSDEEQGQFYSIGEKIFRMKPK